jgi:transcriptional antiterminator NusG
MAKRWYIVHAYSNFENKVAEAIKLGAKQQGLEALIDEVVVPTERMVEVRRGRKVESDRKLFPGYVFVKMEMTDAALVMIKNTPKVTGFLGQDNKPRPIPDAEAAVMLKQVEVAGETAPRPTVSFEIGETVRVSAGPFESLNGKVEEVDDERARLKVAVSIFGRETPVELGFGEVQKLAS